MKIFARSSGDHSVGIGGAYVTIDFKYENLPQDKDERESIRKIVTDMMVEMNAEGMIYVFFEDECVECYQILKNGKCDNKGCIGYNDYEKVK